MLPRCGRAASRLYTLGPTKIVECPGKGGLSELLLLRNCSKVAAAGTAAAPDLAPKGSSRKPDVRLNALFWSKPGSLALAPDSPLRIEEPQYEGIKQIMLKLLLFYSKQSKSIRGANVLYKRVITQVDRPAIYDGNSVDGGMSLPSLFESLYYTHGKQNRIAPAIGIRPILAWNRPDWHGSAMANPIRNQSIPIWTGQFRLPWLYYSQAGLFQGRVFTDYATILLRGWIVFHLEKTFKTTFSLLVIHMWLVLRRLKEEGNEGVDFGQYLYEIYNHDLELRVSRAGMSETAGDRLTAVLAVLTCFVLPAQHQPDSPSAATLCAASAWFLSCGTSVHLQLHQVQPMEGAAWPGDHENDGLKKRSLFVNLLLTKWMKDLEKIFYGNIVAYDSAMSTEAKNDDLLNVVWRNVFADDGSPMPDGAAADAVKAFFLLNLCCLASPFALSRYVRRESTCLSLTDKEAIFSGNFMFTSLENQISGTEMSSNSPMAQRR
ncbi:hypothetical protein Taro_040351 [Colocasia esculenta]|uniref:Ubiquinol-cytochrome c chaperone domain-containing protein n=1 Tax=Colocasia esculenta TaxID=4460 RepID=A0A843WIG9_COLES|nr:hypothetical protein [Colocasia esculenta]